MHDNLGERKKRILKKKKIKKKWIKKNKSKM